MTVCGIVAEFNPFHNGHKYLIDCVRSELKPDAVVVVMSGDFVQRGEPAIQSKFERARAAVNGGADLVIELPVFYATGSAGQFAQGAIRTLKSLGCVTHLAFGSETGDVSELVRAAEITSNESDAFKLSVKSLLDEGFSYPAAYDAALTANHPELSGLFEDKPNNLLAREYLKENILQNAGFVPYAVKRTGVAHNGKIDGFIASASYIRDCLLNEVDITPVTDCVPFDVLKSFAYGEYLDKESFDRFYRLAQYRILTSSEEELRSVPGVSEGLENSLKSAALSCGSLDEFIQNVKGKRYTYSRISRILTRLVLGITNDEYSKFTERMPYVKLLAFNEAGQGVLKHASESNGCEVISNVNKQASESCSKDMEASDIYNIIAGKQLYSGSDRVKIPHRQG